MRKIYILTILTLVVGTAYSQKIKDEKVHQLAESVEQKVIE